MQVDGGEVVLPGGRAVVGGAARGGVGRLGRSGDDVGEELHHRQRPHRLSDASLLGGIGVVPGGSAARERQREAGSGRTEASVTSGVHQSRAVGAGLWRTRAVEGLERPSAASGPVAGVAR